MPVSRFTHKSGGAYPVDPPKAVQGIVYRQEASKTDPKKVRQITASVDVFTPEEIDIAVSLVEDRLERGDKSDYHFWFAEKDGVLLGYSCFGHIGCTDYSYDMYWIAVQGNQRGFGLGKEMVYKTEESIYILKGRRIYVETSSTPRYKSTRAFYQRCGYTMDAVLKDFYRPGDSKVIYVKVL